MTVNPGYDGTERTYQETVLGADDPDVLLSGDGHQLVGHGHRRGKTPFVDFRRRVSCLCHRDDDFAYHQAEALPHNG